jgi:hypothetical protein
MMRAIVILLVLLQGCASVFDGPGYWHKSDRAPVPNAPIKTGRLVPCIGNNTPGCYSIETATIFIKLPAEHYACTERHEQLHACGWDHLEAAPNSEAERCGWHLQLCK